MKHVIFGGDGFVGRHLTESLLERGDEVLICDIQKTDLAIYEKATFMDVDITDPDQLATVPMGADDVVHNMAARLLTPIQRRWNREKHFWDVNHAGAANVLEAMEAQGCRKLVYFTTDMVYGHTRSNPSDESHPREPVGPYGASKKASEDLCADYRKKGFNISIFRPRLIIGPGRLGILENLFWLIDHNLPLPLIGNGSNHYQFISVYDCASAAVCAADKGVPNSEYNLGSKNPPTVEQLLNALIKEAGKHSFLLKTPAGLTKAALAALDFVGLPLLDPEQYLIADEDCVRDVSRAEKELDWHPQYEDQDMLYQAYSEYRKSREK